MDTGKIVRAIGSTLFAGVAAAALAQAPAGDPRGELLYATHCNGCHTTQVHWREKKLATDWPSLVAQVARWQAVGKLGWSGEDVEAVAHHLNARFYRFPPADGKPVGAAPDASRAARHG